MENVLLNKKVVTRDEVAHFIKINVSTHQEDTAFINAPKNIGYKLKAKANFIEGRNPI
jgi:hypothetical protein